MYCKALMDDLFAEMEARVALVSQTAGLRNARGCVCGTHRSMVGSVVLW